MTRIGPTAAARTCKPCAAVKATRRTRRAMCVVCESGRPVCKRSGLGVQLHIEGKPCPRGWHPDKRGIVRWFGRWDGVPAPIRWYLAAMLNDKRVAHGGWRGWYRSFGGCGCNRTLKAAWLRLTRKWRKE